MFAKHHYLAHSHNNSAKVFIALANGEIAGFCSVLYFPHPKVKNMYKVHRLVVLPDYQGVGLGIRLQSFIANHYTVNLGFRFTLVTSQPALVSAYQKDKNWICTHIGRLSSGGGKIQNKKDINTTSAQRITTSWEYIPNKINK